MRSKLRLAASLLATMALVLVAATAIPAANPHTMYTCTKTTNGKTDVKTSVPEPAVGGLTNAGYTCVADAEQGEQDDQGDQGDEQGDQQGDQQGEDDDEPAVEGSANGSAQADDSEPSPEGSSSTGTVQAPPESRSLYCSTSG